MPPLDRRGITDDVAVQDPSLPQFNTLVRIMATRCMLSAEYFCAGSIARDAFAHYGLASPIYTHFTSPIRRYADVLVHRQLSSAVLGTPLHAGLQTKAFVEKTLELVNKRHRSAQQAARASIEFYVALAIQRREEVGLLSGAGKVRAEAFAIRAFRNGLSVFVSQSVVSSPESANLADFDFADSVLRVSSRSSGRTSTIRRRTRSPYRLIRRSRMDHR